MAYTGTEIFNQSIAILDELSDTGTIVESQIKEYKYRAPYLLDLWQHEYAKKGSLFSTVEVNRRPLTNLLGERYDIQEHIDEDKTYETSEAAHSFHFKVDNECQVYVEEYVAGAWANASGSYIQDSGTVTAFTGLITVTALTSPARIKGIITATGTKTRLRFSGSYYYQFYNFALFEAAFPTCARVPEYGEYVKCDMPTNFNSVTQITQENPQSGLYHRWENNKDLYVNYYFDGVLKITYRPTPTKITTITQTLEVGETAATAGAYYLAEHFALADQNSELAQRCRQKYAELKSEDTKERPLAPQTIVDVYDIAGIK
jgi:hypothetical protein